MFFFYFFLINSVFFHKFSIKIYFLHCLFFFILLLNGKWKTKIWKLELLWKKKFGNVQTGAAKKNSLVTTITYTHSLSSIYLYRRSVCKCYMHIASYIDCTRCLSFECECAHFGSLARSLTLFHMHTAAAEK